MNIKAIITAGGKGTRLYPLTFSSNKHTLPIANQPLILYPLENLVKVGIKDIGIVVNDTQPEIEAILGTGSKWGVKITYIHQPEPLGLAHVVKVAEKFVGKTPFVMHNGDNIFTEGIQEPFDHFVKTKPDGLLTVVEHEENYRLGVPFFDKKGKLIKVVEKPKRAPNKFGVPGLYMFNHHVFEAFRGQDAIRPSARGELEIVDLYNYMLKKKYRIEVAQVRGEWRDPGKFDDSLEANRLLLDLKLKTKIQGKVDKDTKISGKIEVGKGSTVVNSRLIGPLSIADNVDIQNSYIGPHTSIANDCEIINSKIDNSILMEDVHLINIRKKVKSSMIGKHTQITAAKLNTKSCSFTVADHCKIELPY
jgi:glucose-1-phosphate thymidylyltransferase